MKSSERMLTEKDANIFSITFWNDQNAIDSSVNQQQGEKEDSQSIRYWTMLTAYQLVILHTIQKVQETYRGLYFEVINYLLDDDDIYFLALQTIYRI